MLNNKAATFVTALLSGAGNRGRTCTLSHKNLNLACLPIPSYPHACCIITQHFKLCQLRQNMRSTHIAVE